MATESAANIPAAWGTCSDSWSLSPPTLLLLPTECSTSFLLNFLSTRFYFHHLTSRLPVCSISSEVLAHVDVCFIF